MGDEKLKMSETYMVKYFCNDFYSGSRSDALLDVKMYVCILAVEVIRILPKNLPELEMFNVSI